MGFNVKKDEDEAQVNELVDVIDRLMMGGQGHLTIDIDETEEGLNVKTYSTSDCGGDGKTACCQPTEEDAVDRDAVSRLRPQGRRVGAE